ncbi:MAG: Asp-tRNA(Asn)/Glu-tRNA(Gln) amidotransferase subunit GatB [Bacilli bacterium]|nr:Asp-tRNA(Asn)/Glu-tRNA(Gln) amidotransferase subunit GatB [Bacilli bacterium]
MLKPTIGIEVHVELNSKNKVFSNSINSFKEAPNTNISEIDIAYPGTLPTLNKEVLEMALKAALALNCNINKHMHFDRKNYFYPDLPKGYQITQKNTPIGYDGYIEINVQGETKRIEIERVHIEEDTCKSIHYNKETFLNYNRAGVPLIEIVTKPVIKSSEEAVLYIESLREQLLYLNISDVKIEEGSMRCDANVSLSDNDILGTKTEIKNIGSITNVGLSIEYEINRQKDLIENGIKIVEETRKFDDKSRQTILMRTKETGNDYRYFPEPDLAFVDLTDEYINKVKSNLPVLPNTIRQKYIEAGINNHNIKTIISNKDICDFYEIIFDKVAPELAANILTGDIIKELNKNHISIKESKLTGEEFINLIKALENNKISSKQCKDLIPLIMSGEKVEKLISNSSFQLITDKTELSDIIDKVLANNPVSIEDYKAGKDRAVKYLMGQIMKESQGKADPKTVSVELISKLKSL